MNFLKKLVLGLFFTVVIVGFTAIVFQWNAARRDDARYPPPGTVVAVNGQELHLVCEGSPSPDSPTVILEAGRGSDSVNWQPVMTLVSEFSHVCAYDRPGLGWSEASSKRLSSAELTVNLHDLLVSAEIPPPYIMVGHSIGGILVRDFTQAYPDKVGGVVLVDSSTENQRELYPHENLSDNELTALKLGSPVIRVLGATGSMRVYRGLRQLQSDDVLTAPELLQLARRNQSHYAQTIVNEMILGSEITSRTEAAKPLGDLPLYVLEKTFWVEEGASEAEIAHEKEWHDLQDVLVNLSTNSRWAEAEMSGHNIPGDDPELIADAIQDVLQRGGSTVLSE